MRYVVLANRYSIEVTQSLNGEFPSPLRRVLRLHDLVQISGPGLSLSPISGIFIAFFDIAPASFGKFLQIGIVNVKAPLSDFDDMYRLVRSQKPIQFVWEESANNAMDIVYYALQGG